MKRAMIAGLVGAALAAGTAATSAAAQEVTLTVHHFLPPKSNAQVGMIEEWAKRVEEQSGGRIEVEIFPSMAMGGSPPELYNQVRDGAADIVWTVLGYTPGVFPRAEVFELPSVHRGSAAATTRAMNASMDMLAEDFKDVHVIFLHSHDGNVLYSAGEPVTAFDQLAGKKLRTPSRTGAWIIESWGAEPVGMPVPDLPQALAKGVVDGALIPYEIAPALKLQELVKSTTAMPGGDRFGAATFVFAMNKDRYEGLPDDLKKVIDDNSGMNAAAWVGRAWEEDFEVRGLKVLEEGGVEHIELSPEEAAKFEAAAEKVVQRWVEEANSKGLDGEALVDEARAAVQAAAQ
jgi:TRAP-type C4-dicarboxylate transport system substrate-binding protein